MIEGGYRRNAISAGILLIIADLVGFLGFPFLAPMNATNYLVSISANQSLIAIGALLLFVGGAAAIGIAISLYPVLRKYNEGLSLGSVGFRTVEGVFYFVGVTCLLLLITLSQQFVSAGAPDSSYFQTFGALLVSGYRWAMNVVSLLAFSIGCLLYYLVFYRTKLIPRWLSGWGIVASLLTMVSALLAMLGLIAPFSAEQAILNFPILLQELALAVWLIIKGFSMPETEVWRSQYKDRTVGSGLQ